ncbi:cbb3-type cytochrome oxidase subunit 3 [Marinospirillum perlucidum]|uniref:cbb3-type cytochrome oxidase subunit 3 n=1 Tax=Marinospirillum perlucidum TaxID=1982602 RepID=UPI000DF3010C|nr:cbb3-type cytochrome c oxidase subunit 3 [Marinospirillum perlucidum]
MDINVFRGLMTIVLLLAFLGIVYWAYSSKQKKPFDEAANLPFADDDENEKNHNQDESSSLEKNKHE